MDSDDDDVPGGGLLEDDRFAAMFKDARFEVDEQSEAYKTLHPNAPKLSKSERRELLEEHFDLDEDEDEDVDDDERQNAADASARAAAAEVSSEEDEEEEEEKVVVDGLELEEAG